jgi:hypothetical protein
MWVVSQAGTHVPSLYKKGAWCAGEIFRGPEEIKLPKPCPIQLHERRNVYGKLPMF